MSVDRDVSTAHCYVAHNLLLLLVSVYLEVVRQRISFYCHPDNITVSPGDRVVFTCAVEGSSVPTVTWLKDGMKSMYGEVKTFQGKGSSTSVLKISSVEEQHVGNYACQATETVENVTSRVAKLTLAGKY